MNADMPRNRAGESKKAPRRRFRPIFACSVLAVLGVTLTSSAALFAQTGPELEGPLPAPRRLPAGAPIEEPVAKPAPAAAPVEEPAPPPHEVMGPIGSMLPSPSSEEPAPMPREQTPPPPPLVLPSAARAILPAELQRLHQEIEGLRLEREAMLSEEMDLINAKEAKAGKADENAQIRRRVTELLLRVAQQNKRSAAREIQPPPSPPAPLPPAGGEGSKKPASPPTPVVHSGGERSKRPPSPPAGGRGTGGEGGKPPAKQPDHSSQMLTDAPVDPLSLAQSLFSTGDHAAALAAYRRLEQEEQKPEQRVAIQYMIACCLRKLGKLDEAAMLYREVAGSGGSDLLVENALWYLRAMKDRRELDAQMEELRQRRQELKPRKP